MAIHGTWQVRNRLIARWAAEKDRLDDSMRKIRFYSAAKPPQLCTIPRQGSVSPKRKTTHNVYSTSAPPRCGARPDPTPTAVPTTTARAVCVTRLASGGAVAPVSLEEACGAESGLRASERRGWATRFGIHEIHTKKEVSAAGKGHPPSTQHVQHARRVSIDQTRAKWSLIDEN